MLLKKIVRNELMKFLIYVFLLHGMLVFIFPEQYHNSSGWLVYVKYLSLISIIVLYIDKLYQYPNLLIYFLSILFMFFFGTVISSRAVLVLNDALYIIPIFSILLAPSILSVFSKSSIIKYIIIISLVFAIIEFLFFSTILSTYSRHVFRSSSIFVNPNNLAIIIGIAINYVVCKNVVKFREQTVLVLASAVTIILSGSKTGLLLLLLSILLMFLNKRRALPSLIILCIGTATILLLLFVGLGESLNFGFDLNLRGMELKSGENRLGAYSEFTAKLTGVGSFPRWEFNTHLDNTFFHMWGNLGLITAVFFICQHMFIGVLSYKLGSTFLVLFIAFTLSMLTTNIMYIWPASYLYWFFCGSVFSYSFVLKKNNNVSNREFAFYEK